MITFLSTTQLNEFCVKIYHRSTSRSTDFICNFLITEYPKHHRYQVHYISQSKKDSVIVSTDVTYNCLITKYSNKKCQKYQVYYILHSILNTEYSIQKPYPLYYTSQSNYNSVKISMQIISNFVITEYSNQNIRSVKVTFSESQKFAKY